MSPELASWLAFIERQHSSTIALGLERIATLLPRIGRPKAVPIITVGGTNGKGSTCAMLEAMLGAAGFRVGLYTSPHLLRYNERVRIDREEASDDVLVNAFAAVEAARGDMPLTYFEFGTLAAWIAFADAALDVMILEVGLGGRLDAVNAFEPDCAIVTTVDLDHMDYLGDTREQIGWEKAHIFRAQTPALCADPNPPATLIEYAQSIGANLRLFGRDFGFEAHEIQWTYWSERNRRGGLAYPALRGGTQLRNAAAAIAALESLHAQLPVPAGAIRSGLATVALPGRFQVLPGVPTIILDVGHNPEAARVLAMNLADMAHAAHTIAICGVLRDKDAEGICRALGGSIDEWFAVGLPGERGRSAAELEAAVRAAGLKAPVFQYADVASALAAAKSAAGRDDRIVVFGSFLTVAAAMAALNAH
ncbi:MAG: bifunctional tetrahydrofolate synthase/dihydrofolate synthase [Burkholderiales bacterium]